MVAPRKGNTKHLFGSVKVGERGQIVIPKEAREIFDIKPGDIMLVLVMWSGALRLLRPMFCRNLRRLSLNLQVIHGMNEKKCEKDEHNCIKRKPQRRCQYHDAVRGVYAETIPIP